MKKLIFIFLLFFSLQRIGIGQNCPFSVNAGTDITICEPGGTVPLNGNISGSYLFSEWSPGSLLSDSTILNPSADVFQTTLFTLTAYAPGSTNLIVNGDFEQGNTGFSSDYLYAPNDLINSGSYSVTTSPDIVSTIFPPCVDHTTGMGQMMIVNGDGTIGANVWCQTVSISPNTYYDFSFWVATAQPIFPGELSVSINGTPVGNSISLPSSFCSWTPYDVLWYSGSATTATICIVNQSSNGGLLGNDFLLDDIALIPYCEESDDVLVEIVPASVSFVDAVLCEGECFFVGTTPYCNDFTGSTVISSVNGCDSTVNLNLEILQPVAAVFPYSELNCIINSITLSAVPSVLDPVANVSYEWSGPNGFFVAGKDALVFEEGDYTLTVSHEQNGVICSAMTTVTVSQDDELPIVDPGGNLTIDCFQAFDTLDGGNSSSGPEFSILWTGPDGFSSGILTPEVNVPGIYSLTIVNTSNGCVNTATAEVFSLIDTPYIQVLDNVLSCDSSSVSLIIDSTESNVNYLWAGPNGFESTLANPMVSDTGQYILTITDGNGCSGQDTAFVSEDIQTGFLQISGDTLINCVDTVANLLASFSIPLDTFWWSGADGFITSDTTVDVNMEGTYIFYGQSLDGCLDSTEFFVFQDTITPFFQLSGESLNCIDTIANIDLFPIDSSFNYQWNGPDSFQDSGFNISVSQAGWYMVSVTGVNGCETIDSIEIISNVIQPIILLDTLVDCSSSYSDTLIQLSQGGCDSLIQISFFEYSPPDSIYLSASSCQPSDTGWVTQTYTNASGCDSLVFTYTSLVEADTSFFSNLSCNVLDTGITISVFQSTLGCDSVVITQTDLLLGDTTYEFSSSCNALDTGIVVEMYTNAVGCDSVVITQTDLLLGDTTYEFSSSCNALDTGIVVEMYTNAVGCDNMVITQTDLLLGDTAYEFSSSCNALDTGIVVEMYTNAVGCDSVVLTQTDLLLGDTTYEFSSSCNALDTGVLVEMYTNAVGCDSVVITQTDLLLGDTTYEFSSSCNALDTGILVEMYTNAVGCDSVVITQTDLLLGDTTFDFSSSCNALDTGIVVEMYTNAVGCDSVVLTQTDLLLGDTTYEFSSSCNALDTGILVEMYTNAVGCDSVVITQTDLLLGDTTFDFSSSCNALDTGIVVEMYTNAVGCDSVVLTQTDLLLGDTTYEFSSSCNALDTGILVEMYTNAVGCDSVVLTQTDLLLGDTTYDFSSSCNALDTGMVVEMYTNAVGCDSVVITQTDLLLGDTTYEFSSSCNPLDTGLQVIVLTNQAGCDSVVLTSVSLLLPSYDTIFSSLCQGDSIFIVNNWFFSDTIFIDTLTGEALNGCDSIITYNLSVTPLEESFIEATICEGESYTFGGLDLTLPGLYIDTVNASVGCDTIISLNLSIESVYEEDLGTFELCEGEAYVFNGTPIAQTGVFTDTLESQGGCDSILTVALNFSKPELNVSFDAPDCYGENSGSILLDSINSGTLPVNILVNGFQSFEMVSEFPFIIDSLEGGFYQIEVEDASGCENIVELEIPSPPFLFLGFPNDVVELEAGNSIELNPLVNFNPASIQWVPDVECGDCLDPTVNPEENTRYFLFLQDSLGCEVESSVFIQVFEKQGIYLPNVFSPNEDGFNDIFYLSSANPSQFIIETFQIYDRWGQLVFNMENTLANDPSSGWDGTFKGKEMNPGVFVYLINIKWKNGQLEQFTGSVSLIR